MKKIIALLFTVIIGSSVFAQTDHSMFVEGPFDSPQAVTETCLMCHEGTDKEIMQTRHWKWKGEAFTKEDGETVKRGKINTINNFCVAVPSNWARCTSCHIGYGWEDETFDFAESKNIDCLICHEQSGEYKKVPTGAGVPHPDTDLGKVAQSVGKTQINNCAVCHFDGGGGTGVKHGDMDESLRNPSPELDVHMGALGFTCADCHAGENHKILGASHGSMATGDNHISCLGCHEERPHTRNLLNNHVSAVACETCHIPAFAREEPTKTWWDWSTAGQDKKETKDKYGNKTYMKKKGSFVWSKNVVPEYRWYNGKADYYYMGDKISPDKTVKLNELQGNIDDPDAKIAPFKLMRGKQIYDTQNNYLIVPKLFGKGGYWKTFDWNAAAEKGMATVNLDYSGEYGFIETEMYWPINHMVAPAKDALKCTACHTRKDSKRLNWKKLGYEGDPMSKGGRSL